MGPPGRNSGKSKIVEQTGLYCHRLCLVDFFENATYEIDLQVKVRASHGCQNGICFLEARVRLSKIYDVFFLNEQQKYEIDLNRIFSSYQHKKQ